MADLLTPKQLCERWGGSIKEQTLANWRTEGKGPKYIKAGRKVLYKIKDVERFENSK